MTAPTAFGMKRMVDRLGQQVTLRKVAYGAYNVATGTVGSTTNTDYTAKAYVADYNLSELDQDNVVFGDRKVVLTAFDTSGNALPEPDAEDFIIGAGDSVKVVSVQKIYHANSLVCYICQVRE